MKEVIHPTENGLDLAQEVAHDVVSVDDLLDDLAATLLPFTPPGRVERIAKIPAGHQSCPAGFPAVQH